VVHFSPAPESALPLMPRAGALAGAALEFQALLTRLAPERDREPTLLSVHTLRGRIDQRLEGLLGPGGEYRVSFVPRRDRDPGRVILREFRFTPADGARQAAPQGSDIALSLDVPRRIEPPMEPETGGALVLQITVHQRTLRESDV